MANNRERINKLKVELSELQSGLKSVEETLSKHANLDASLQKYKERAVEIQTAIEAINTSVTESQQSIKSDAEEMSALKVDADKLLEDVGGSVKKIENVYDKLFGEADSDGKRTGGLYTEIKERINEIDTKHEEQNNAYQELLEKVESLLPGATSAGLAKAYADQKATYAWPEVIWSTITVAAMCGITALGYVTFRDATTVTKTTEAIALLITRLPIFVGVTWLAIYAGKQQSQNGRLRQEYAHKETMARSLEGYKREIEDLEDTQTNTVLNKLMINVVESVAFNPSTTLDKKHDNKPPYVSEIINGVKSAIGIPKKIVKKEPEKIEKVAETKPKVTATPKT